MIILRTYLTTPEPVIYYEAKRNESIVFSIDKDSQKIQGEMESITTEEISSVKEWIKLNYDALMSHWKEPDSVKLCHNIKLIESNSVDTRVL